MRIESTDIELTFTEVGTYVYSLYEAAPDIKEGFDCDESKYTPTMAYLKVSIPNWA